MLETVPRQSDRVRRAVLDDIAAEGRRQLAHDGAAGLSLRSVAHELGMVSSGIYRYVESRDALLTMLIATGYDRLGAAVERATPATGSGRQRWHAACAGLRAWARAHPHEYALLYGSPVPGYEAPGDTIPPAERVYSALAAPLRGAGSPAAIPDPALAADAEAVAAALGPDLTPAQGLALLHAFAGLFGVVSLERFGHTTNVVTDHDAFFARHVDRLADDLGL